MRRLRLLVLAVALVMPLLAGCGGSDILSEQELIDHGDEICDRLDDRLDELGVTRSYLARIHPETTDDVLLDAAAAVDDAVEDFRGLQAPPDGRVVKGQIVLRLRDVQQRFRQAVRAVIQTRPSGVHSEGFGTGAGGLAELAEGQDAGDAGGDADRYAVHVETALGLLQTLHDRAAEYGFENCSEDFIDG